MIYRCATTAAQIQGFKAASPEQVHSKEPRDSVIVRIRAPAPDRLVADDDPALVGAHLGAPHPGWLAQDHGVGLGHLRDADVRALKKWAVLASLRV